MKRRASCRAKLIGADWSLGMAWLKFPAGHLLFCLFSPVFQYVLKPTFAKQHITSLDKQAKLSRAYDGTTYLPGIVGLNNIKANDYANAVLQVPCHL